MANQTTILTGLVRFSYVNIFTPREGLDGGEPKYSIVLLIRKEDSKTLDRIKAAIAAATEEGKSKLWSGKLPKGLKSPLHDGDLEKDAEEYENKMYIAASSKRKPGIVDENLEDIIDQDEVYSGCWGRAQLRFFPYNNKSAGIGCSLENLQKLKDDERFGTPIQKAADAFGEEAFEDDDDLY